MASVDAVNVGLNNNGIVLTEMLMLVALEGQQVDERVVRLDDVKRELHAVVGLQRCALKRRK